MIPPCNSSVLHLALEVLLLLRKCPFIEIRIRVLDFCKVLIGNIPRLKVIGTDYAILATIYALVLGVDTINISSYKQFDSLENEKKIIEMIIEILDFGYYYHYIAFHPTFQNHAKIISSPLLPIKTSINSLNRIGKKESINTSMLNAEIESFMPSNFFHSNKPELDEKALLDEKKEEQIRIFEMNPELMKRFPSVINSDSLKSQGNLQEYDKFKNDEWKIKAETDRSSGFKKPSLSNDDDDVLRYEDLAIGPDSSSIIEEFINAHTKSELDLSLFCDNNHKSDNIEESMLNTGDSFLIQQSALIKLPFAKKNITKSIPLVIRHLIFSKNDSESFDYFHMYSQGLLSGSLQFKRIDLINFPSSKGVKPLHPMIKNIASLDMHLILELLQGFEMQNTKIEDELFSWISGLTDVHRHLLPLSRSIHEVEYELKRDLTIAECLVIIRDKLSIIKLSINTSLFTEADIDKLESAANLGIEKSRVMGSMILLEDSFSKWLSYLL